MNPIYKMLDSEAMYREAVDTVLARAEHQILIFDRDLLTLRIDQKSRLDALTGFLRADPVRRIRIVLHNPEPVERNAPHLLRFIGRFSNAIDVRQTPANLRHLADTHVLADENCGARRFHVDQPRSALILDDPAYLHPWRQRFEELWSLSHPCLRITTTGL